jgi:glycosyltransferase involved in cell wall biosynthesis
VTLAPVPAGRGLDLLYVGTLPPRGGGSAVLASLLLTGLAARGHAVRALAPIAPGADRQARAFERRHPSITVRRFRVPYLEGARDDPSPPAYRTLERRAILAELPALVRGRPPDAVVLGRESVAWHASVLTRRRSLPSLLIVHGGRTFGTLLRAPGDRRGRALLARIRGVDRVVAVARHLAADLERLGVGNVDVIRNPVDLRSFEPREGNGSLRRVLGIRKGDVVVMHVSRLATIKRPLDLVHSARRALAREPRLLYVVVGEGPLRADVRRAVRELDLEDRFRFVGCVPHERVADYLNLADVVALTSETEGQPLVCLEAQACGRAVLASDIPGVRELITNGKDGLLFKKGDLEDLTARTLLLAGSAALRARIGALARARAERHSLDRTVADYSDALQGLMDDRRGARPAAALSS